MRCEYCVSAGYAVPHDPSPMGRDSHLSISLVTLYIATMDLELHTACLVLWLSGLSYCMRRGPHHPHGQQPVEPHHHHYRPVGGNALTGDSQLLHDIKHIEEDTKVLTPEALAKMTPEELEFHYFSAHDFDKNSKLDGLELLKAVYHTLEHEAPDHDADLSIEPEANSLDSYIALVDLTLDKDDADSDGYVSYAEYRAARKSSEWIGPRVS